LYLEFVCAFLAMKQCALSPAYANENVFAEEVTVVDLCGVYVTVSMP
jgi:hypothetical protein